MKLLILLTLIACNSSYKHRTDWKKVYEEEGFKDKCRVNVKETIKVKGVLDGKGCTYNWSGKYKEHCHAPEEVSENHPRLFEMEPNSTIKNMKIDCILEGIRMNDNTRIENVDFWDCGEECISTNGKNNLIYNNKFYLASDKTIQGNSADVVHIKNNFFKHVTRAFSGSAGGKGAQDVFFHDNHCVNCEIMVRAQGDHTVEVKGNLLEGGECMLESVDKSRITNKGGNVVKDAKLICKDNANDIK